MVIQGRTIVISESVIAAELDGEAILLDVVNGIYFGLDEVGTRIWGLLTDGLSPTMIRDELLAEYDVDPESLESDVSAFLDRLLAKGLARVVDRE